MITIQHTDNAVKAVGDINTNLGEDVVNVADSATEMVQELNSAFEDIADADVLSANDNAVDFVDGLNANFEKLEDGGQVQSLKFYHISDTHTCLDSINECKRLMGLDGNDIAFTILTGDYAPRTGSMPTGDEYDTALKSFGDSFLMLNGNHDAWNGWNKNSQNATAYLKAVVTDDRVVWGETTGKASYWYIDFPLGGGRKLRIIGVDSYEYWYDNSVAAYDTVYTTAQANWFIDRIKELSSKDYLIVAEHEPPINSVGSNDQSCVAKRRVNDFCSSRIFTWDSSFSNASLWPTIINAYKNRIRIREAIANEKSGEGTSASGVTVDADFRYNKPCTFIGFLCGHMHADMHEYHPDFPDQLIMAVDWGNTGNSSESDIQNRSHGILINEVTLDFTQQRLIINRIGNNAAGAYNGFPALTRTTITFPFVREINKS